MSTQAVTDFLQKVAEDSTLQSELANMIGAENDREAVTQLAQRNGYEFSSEELWAEVQKRQAEFEAKRASGELELSDEELEAVAGGEIVSIAMSAIFLAATVGLSALGGTLAATAIKGPAAW